MATTVEAPIVAVTVYPQQARITRRGRASLADGARLRIAGLPLSLDAESVRVTGTGAALVTGVDVSFEQHAEPADATLRALVEQRREDQATLDAAADDEAAEAAKVEMLTGVARRSGTSFAKALAAGDAEPGRVAEVSDALGTQLAAALKGRRAVTARLDRLREDLAALDRRIEAHSAQSEQDSSTVTVELEPLDGTENSEVELELSYVVPGASWQPGHDVRVRDAQVTVTSHGLVSQHTGEDWPECELALSTARPANTVVVPELQPWYLDRRVPPPPAPAAAYGATARPRPGGRDRCGSTALPVRSTAMAPKVAAGGARHDSGHLPAGPPGRRCRRARRATARRWRSWTSQRNSAT